MLRVAAEKNVGLALAGPKPDEQAEAQAVLRRLPAAFGGLTCMPAWVFTNCAGGFF